jgi:nucleoside-diphosphate-sugar epimerase
MASAQRRAVVTGITGMVGDAVARLLAAQGWTVRGLVRTRQPSLPGHIAEVHVGQLDRPESLAGACRDADLVVHAGGVVSDWAPAEVFWRVNRDGTRALLEEARRSGAGRFTYVGTANVFGFRSGELISEDSAKVCPPFLYPRSKLAAEDSVWEYGERGLDVTVIYPTWVFGPGDRHLVPEMVANLRAGRFVHIGGGRAHLELTYSENLAEAIVLASTVDAGRGRGFIVGDDYDVTLGEFTDAVAATAGVKSPRLSIPFRLAAGLGRASEAFATLTRSSGRPMLTHYAVRALATGVRFDLGRIRSLGYRPAISLHQGLAQTLAAPPVLTQTPR